MADKKKNNKIKKTENNTNIKSIYKSNNKTKTKKEKNPYKIIKKIGEGSYGIVYLIKMETNLSLCVLKKIDLKGLSKQEIKDTYKEVNLLKKLDHPNIIKFVEVNSSKRYLEIITEYAEKGDLYNQICIQIKKKIPFPEKKIIDWLIQICQALKYIHSKHIIHRDIKPQNIFLSNNGCIKLGDFGVSKTLNNTLEKAKTFVGTVYYLPPEIIEEKNYSYTADIWSLGITFYQLMTFKMPYDGDSLPAIIKKISNGSGYAKINKKLYSEDLINLVYKMMDNKPKKRPKANDILNMDFIKKRIQVYLKENQFDDILSKTIIKNYQVNYGFNKKDNNNINYINDNNNANNINNENIEKSIEIVDLKNKLKFNKIIELSKENNNNTKNEKKETKEIKDIKNIKDNNSNLKKDNIGNNENNEEKKDKEKQKVFLGQILLNNENSNTKTDSNNSNQIKDNFTVKTKEKNENVTKNNSIERPKIKIKIISSQKNTKSIVKEQMNIKKNENDKIENDKKEKENNFDSTIKTNMTSYNPEDVKYGFETKYIENNMKEYGDGEKEINLEKINEFIFETQKENEIRQNLKDEYDQHRNLNLLNSIIMGKSDNDVENENELINHNESDIEENDEDNNDETH